jgi:hypothetical protein
VARILLLIFSQLHLLRPGRRGLQGIQLNSEDKRARAKELYVNIEKAGRLCPCRTLLHWFATFIPNWDFGGFSLYINNLAGRQLYRVCVGGRSGPFCVLLSIKRRVR